MNKSRRTIKREHRVKLFKLRASARRLTGIAGSTAIDFDRLEAAVKGCSIAVQKFAVMTAQIIPKRRTICQLNQS